MNTIVVSKFHKVRVSYCEVAGDLLVAGSRSSATILANQLGPRDSRIATIESRSIVGPRSIYGLLGATCEPHEDGLVSTFYVDTRQEAERKLFKSDLVSGGGVVLSGIAPEYEKPVFEGAHRCGAAPKLGGCAVTFKWGASSEIDSCRDIFVSLSQALIELFAHESWPPTDAMVVDALCGRSGSA